MSAASTALIILASGLSKRFEGGNKLLADLNGRPVASYAIAASAPMAFARRYAVIVDYNSELGALFLEAGFTLIRNPNPDAGHTVSRALGLEAVKASDLSQACILLADMPGISTSHLSKLFATGGNIIMSRNAGIMMPPILMRDLNAPIEPEGSVELTTLAARDIDTQQDLAAMALAMSEDRL